MAKFFRYLGLSAVGIMMIPVSVVATKTLWVLFRSLQPDSGTAVTPAGWAILIGFAVWNFLYITLPSPVRSYVLAHELTHALWATLMGARVSKMKIGKNSGSVTVSKSNFLITLAPYFFPFYTVMAVLVYVLLSLFLDMSTYYLYWIGVVGFTWGFHLTFTINTLMEHQSDIMEYGYIFSYSLIYLLNIVGIAIWIVAVTDATFIEFADMLGSETAGAFYWCWMQGIAIWQQFAQ